MKQITHQDTKERLQFAQDQIEFGNPGATFWKKEGKGYHGEQLYSLYRNDMNQGDGVAPARTRNQGVVFIREDK